jgi:hypothetical protein
MKWDRNNNCLFLLFFILNTPALSQPQHLKNIEKYRHIIYQIVELTNQERAARNLPPLKLQFELTRAAMWLAYDQAQYNYFGHRDCLGRSSSSRILSFQYKNPAATGENIAGGHFTPERVVNGWMQSPGHRRNILARKFREIGIGYDENENSRFYKHWVQTFGARWNVFPLVINNEAETTDSREVELYIYTPGRAEEMRFSSDNQHWTEWEPYYEKKCWTLTAGDGPKNVHVQIRNAEKTTHASDSILLREKFDIKLISGAFQNFQPIKEY